MSIEIKPFTLKFNFPAGTSRGVLHEKESLILRWKNDNMVQFAEASFIPGLSMDTFSEVKQEHSKLKHLLPEKILLNAYKYGLSPSYQFALETLTKKQEENSFTKGVDGIPINGLIWMGEIGFMQKQIQQKLDLGFNVIKLKIGAIKWEEELALLKKIRTNYLDKDLEIRVDANGGFEFEEVQSVLDQLYHLKIHSIEQPIKKGQVENMHALCTNTPVPIALDEELIGIKNFHEKSELIAAIKPQYLILKPGLLGGFKSCEDWMKIAKENNAGYWITSALESNIGLNAIAQWTYQLNLEMPQGLGTGGLYLNNIPSPLEVKGNKLYYNPNKKWDYSMLYF